MLTFGINFFICNIYIALFVVAMISIKRLLKKYLSERIQYNLWFLLLFLLAIPFLPLPIFLSGLSGIFPKPGAGISSIFTQDKSIFLQSLSAVGTISLEKINDFAVSVSAGTPLTLNILILVIWAIGIFTMFILFLRSWLRFRLIEKSALPLQNETVQTIFHSCLSEMGITKKIPVYSTSFIKSPVIAGIFKPRIYMPIHLISDFEQADIRYMLLHELQHYRHKDTFVNYLINLSGILYWFNPFVWYALREMRIDREVACDASVLQMLEETDYTDYGNTLINFAEKISFMPFPFASEIGGSMKQIKRRILNIAYFKKETWFEKVRSIVIYLFIAAILLGFSPVLSTYGADTGQYTFHKDDKNIVLIDLSADFADYEGSFVLYDENNDTWSIYNEVNASTRVSPNSTYKIYDALLGLENGIITPRNTHIAWNGEDYPFDAWESDQDLTSAMQNSVNWYFQSIDSIVGFDTVKSFLQEIGYGNQTVSSDLEMYWTDLSLKISPIEQVELLKKFYHNEFQFSEDNVQTVKNAILLSSAESVSLYGKTGTGRVDEKDVNGWFIGYVETSDNVYYFAANIQGTSDTTGSEAADIALSILSDLEIWE